MKLYFYKRTTYPTDAHYYNLTKGIAGYRKKRADDVCLFEGTVEELEGKEDTQARSIYRKTYRALN